MPLKKKPYTKKRVYRKRRYRKKATVGRRLSTGSVYNFKRTNHEVISVGTSGNGWLLNGSIAMGKTFDFRLADINENTDFINLFRFYKINAVRVRIWNANTITPNNNYQGNFGNNQVILRYDYNTNGITTGNDDQQIYMNSQTSKMRSLIRSDGKPIDILMRCKQSNMVYKSISLEPSLSNTGYTLKKPGWISTTEPNVAHYALNMMIHRLDDDALSAGMTNQQKIRFEYTYYISCKKAQ